jgi:hypothetical protein
MTAYFNSSLRYCTAPKIILKINDYSNEMYKSTFICTLQFLNLRGILSFDVMKGFSEKLIAYVTENPSHLHT